ncbi:MAG: hypothetical protein KGQ41_07440 [Alphaproteobacteria bacterium]|nr:hypothetical protein [Alphaproteobacteria bacterium]
MLKTKRTLTNAENDRLQSFFQAVREHPNQDAVAEFCDHLHRDADGEFRFPEEIVIRSEEGAKRVMAFLPKVV